MNSDFVSPAVPLSVPMPDRPLVGTGFFASFAGQEWLITVAHLPFGHPHLHSRWIEWPGMVQLHRVGCSPILIPLFSQTAAGLDPRFAYLGGGVEPVADFMAFHTPAGSAKRFSAELYDLGGAPPQVGSRAVISGYPSKNGQWPPAYPLIFPVTVTGASNELVRYAPAAPNGTSGGPVVGIDGALHGMTIGFNGDGKAVSTFAITEILKANMELGLPRTMQLIP